MHKLVALLCACLAVAVVAADQKKADAAAPPQEFVYYLFSKECYHKFFTLNQFTDAPCVSLAVSKALGYLMIGLSFTVKVPQMINIIRAGSVQGLAPIGFYLETVAFTSSAAYNLLQGFPFSTYGETLTILAQNIILVLLLWTYMPERLPVFSVGGQSMVGIIVGYALMGAAMWNVPAAYQFSLVAFTVSMILSARIPQIIKNFKNSSTGVLSLGTVGMNMFGALARVFTTLAEVDDPFVLGQFCLAAGINITLFLQIVIFWSNTNKELAAAQAQNKKKTQ